MTFQITKDEKSTVILSPFSFSTESRKIYKKWFSNPQNQRMMGYKGNTFDDTDIDRWKESIRNDISQIMYNIVLMPKELLIGMCSITILSDAITAELELLIGEKEYRSMGLGTIALRLLLDKCFDYLDLKKVIVKVYADNIVAISCYKKTGFFQTRNYYDSDRELLIFEKVNQKYP